MLNSSGESGYFCLIPDLRRKTCILSPLSMLFTVFVNVLYQLKEVPSISGYLVFVFKYEHFVYINYYGSMIFLF